MAITASGTQTWSKPKRIEGHTSNVEQPILYVTYGVCAPASCDAGGGFYLTHKLSSTKFVSGMPTNAAGATMLYGANAATDGAHFGTSSTVPWETVGASAIAGATTLTLGSGSSEVADVYNGATMDVQLTSGNIQTVTISDYAVTTNVATFLEPLTEAVAATGTYRIRGTVVTTVSAATTPTFNCQVIGSFEG
jgi:hypothetical protein